MNREFKIKEAMKTSNGKLIYVIELQQGDKDKIQMYIDRNNEIYFESNSYNFSSYATFDITQDSHQVAKEIFLTYLQAYVKTQLLNLKQLELILEAMGLKNVIRKTIVDNSSMLLETKEEIIQASIENTTKLIEESTKSNQDMVKNSLNNSKKIIKASIEKTENLVENKTNEIIESTLKPIIEAKAIEVVEENVRAIARKKKK